MATDIAVNIVRELTGSGIYLYVDGGDLKYKSAKGAFTDAWKQAVRENRTAIISYLQDLKQQRTQQAADIPELLLQERPEQVPLSYSQHRLWFIDQLGEGSTQFNMHDRFLLSGNLHEQAFGRSLAAVLDRHEVLRTRYREKNGEIEQVVISDYELPLTRHDLTDLTDAKKSEAVERISREEAKRLFDLSRDLVLRVQLLKLSADAHLVLYTLHHIAGDGWSLSIFQNEFNALYKAFSSEQSNPLTPLSIQYADYAIWQRNWLQGAVLEQELEYWKSQLDGIPMVHGLPLDRPRPPRQSFDGRLYRQELDTGLSKRVRQLCESQGVTLFMFMETAFTVLLAHYSNQSDIVIGSPIAGRNHAETEGLIGFFVNTLVLRTRLSASLTFSALLKQNRQMILEAYEHQHIPFERLVEELSPERHLSHNSLTQINFGVQIARHEVTTDRHSSHDRTMDASGYLSLHEMSLPFELKLDVYDLGEALSLAWFFRISLFHETSIARMANNFRVLLAGICDNLEAREQEAPIEELNLLSDSEEETVLYRWNADRPDYRKDQCVHELFEQFAESSTDAVAVVRGNERFSYGELNARANQLARFLVEQGSGPDTFVALCIERSFDMVVALIAVLKAGAAYVPMDPSYPENRLAYMLRDSEAPIVLTQSHLLDRLPLERQQCICLDDPDLRATLDDYDVINPPQTARGLSNEHLAYVIYTSGSTGNPKGTMVSHRSVCDFLNQAVADFLDEHIVGAVVSSPLAFDATVGSLLVPLAAGRYARLLPEGLDAIDSLGECFADQSNSFLFKITPSHLAAVRSQGIVGKNMRSRHVIVVAGELLYPSLVHDWQCDLLPNSLFINEYGPTEAAVGCATWPIPENLHHCDTGSSTVPIGRRFGDTELYVLNRRMLPQCIGSIGELYIGGEGLARGYLRRPALTAERFVPNPYSGRSGARLYRTGDLVRHLANGDLEFVTRSDNQIKLRGFRIELGEIESQLLNLDEVRETAVVSCELAAADRRLVAYVSLENNETEFTQADAETPNAGADLSAEERSSLVRRFKHFLKLSLPEFMVPETYVFLRQLPLTPNGKIDRNALPRPDVFALQQEAWVAPRTRIEKNLCEIWQQQLKVERVGVFDNFFALGGHSLLATKIVSAIRRELEVELPLRALFESPTVAGLSEVLVTQAKNLVLPPIERADRSEQLPLSYSQQRLWFIDQLGEGSVQFNMPGYFLFEGDFDRKVFERALKALLDRHEVLRTHFSSANDGVQQIIAARYDLPLRNLDLSVLEEGEKIEQARRLIDEEVAIPFDLSEDLMLRVLLLKLSESQHLVAYTIHHIASDGISRGILQRDLTALYTALCEQEVNPLPELPVQYADYALWQRQWLQGRLLENGLAYWKNQLAGIPAVHSLPLDKPRPATQRFMGKSLHTRINGLLLARIKAMCQKHGCTFFMFMHTAMSVLLSRYSAQRDIVVGTAINGRHHHDTENLIGFFINDLVLRVRIPEHASFAELLDLQKQVILDAYAWQYIPFEMLVEELNPQRSMSHSPLFQIKLDERSLVDAGSSLPDLEFTNLAAGAQLDQAMSAAEHNVKHDLYISVAEQANTISLYWLYNTDLFLDDSILRLSSHFATLLESIVDAPTRDVNSLSLFARGKQLEHLHNCDRTGNKAAPQKCIHQLFEAKAAQSPESPAVIYESETLTYGELNEQANRLAHYLISQGIGPDHPVALCLEASTDMIVAILGVLKAGAAYVPLQVSAPQERLDMMLDDCACTWVLTQNEVMTELVFGDRRVLPIDAEVRENLLSRFDSANPDICAVGLKPEHLAYIIYTSGSTNKPKGVMVEHQALMQYCEFARSYYYRDDLAGSLVASSYSFDLTIPGLFLPLLAGDYVRLLPEVNILESLASALNSCDRALLLRITPSHVSGIVPALKDTERSCAHAVIIGGEALAVKTCRALQAKLPDADIYNHYGPTEAIIGCSIYPVSRDADLTGYTHCPIGKPMEHTRLLVLNEQLQLNPVGMPGELHVGGRLARGYLNQECLTAEKFIRDPFSDNADDRLYKTGDLVRCHADGNLEFIGRIDNQVKIRGLRIELGEIEQRLLALNGIRDCAVEVKSFADDEQRLVAYVVPGADLADDAEDEGAVIQRKQELIMGYRRALMTNLPDYMVPQVYLFLDSLPLTSNGKLDRQTLPMPREADLLKSRYAAPRNELETTLCRLWQEVLNLEQVGIEDDFFLLGGHSLLATRLINYVRKEFDIEITLRVLFEKTTISQLSPEIMACIIERKFQENAMNLEQSDDIEEVLLD